MVNSPFFNNTNYAYTTPAGFSDQRYGTDSNDGKSKGLLTGTVVFLLEYSGVSIKTIFYYDNKGRVIQSIASGYPSGFEKEYTNILGNLKYKSKPILIRNIVNYP